ncbi:hypothetical protein IV102_00675 [bacterium]|nr:hypothetical protein [bacterium]
MSDLLPNIVVGQAESVWLLFFLPAQQANAILTGDMQPVFHSSGTFTLDQSRQDSLLGQFSLEEPALAVLLLVQGAVASAASAISIKLEVNRVVLELRLSSPMVEPLPVPLQRLDPIWGAATPTKHGWTWGRRGKAPQLQRELFWLEQRARFCPVPLKINGYIVQPENHFYTAPKPAGWLRKGYHLAEQLKARQADQPGLAIFRPDAGTKTILRPNSEHTYWRELEDGVESLRWWMPWRVAGQVARLKSCAGYRVSQAAFLLAQSGQPSRIIAVHHGVVVQNVSVDWPELPGLCLIFDASQRKLDLSGLSLVNDANLTEWLQHQRQQLNAWVSQRVERWNVKGRSHNVTSLQNRREIGAWLSIWGASLITGLAAYLPLPLLGLPWIVWHHSSRKKIFEHWKQRLLELGLNPQGEASGNSRSPW